MNSIIWSNFGLMLRQNKPHSDRGFTLFEVLTAALIISLLVAIALPNFIKSKDKGFEASMESNARTLRIMLETYKVDQGVYPEDLRTLGREATSKGYNKRASNPLQGAKDVVESGKWAIDYVGTTGPAGMVVYQPINANTKYYIFAYNTGGKLLKRNGQVFTMSNG